MIDKNRLWTPGQKADKEECDNCAKMAAGLENMAEANVGMQNICKLLVRRLGGMVTLSEKHLGEMDAWAIDVFGVSEGTQIRIREREYKGGPEADNGVDDGPGRLEGESPDA